MKITFAAVVGALASLASVVDWHAVAQDPKKLAGAVLAGLLTVAAGLGKSMVTPSVESARATLDKAIEKENDRRAKP